MASIVAVCFIIINILNGAVSEDAGEKKKVTEALNVGFELGKLTNTVQQLKQTVSDMKAQDKSLRETVSALEKQDGALKAMVSKLETQAAASLSKERALQGEVAGLKQQLAAMSSQNTALGDQVGKLRSSDGAFKNEIQTLKTQNNDFKNTLKSLQHKTDANALKASAVEAFSAGLSKHIPNHWLGIIVFDSVKYMYGRGYNSATGKFTASIHGLYAFHAVITTMCQKCHGIVGMYLNDKDVGKVSVVSTPYNVQSSMSTVFAMKKGDVVYMKKDYGASGIHDFPFTFFSGYLIRPF